MEQSSRKWVHCLSDMGKVGWLERIQSPSALRYVCLLDTLLVFLCFLQHTQHGHFFRLTQSYLFSTLNWSFYVHRSLQRTLNELKEYQKQHDHYLRQQEVLEKHKLIQEEQILRNIIHETQMAKEAQLGNSRMSGCNVCSTTQCSEQNITVQ